MLSSIREKCAQSASHSQAKYNIIDATLSEPCAQIAHLRRVRLFAALKREGETALDRPLALSEVERASIAGQEGTIPLRQQIANIH